MRLHRVQPQPFLCNRLCNRIYATACNRIYATALTHYYHWLFSYFCVYVRLHRLHSRATAGIPCSSKRLHTYTPMRLHVSVCIGVAARATPHTTPKNRRFFYHKHIFLYT